MLAIYIFIGSGIILVSTLIFMYFDGKNFRKNMKHKYEVKISNDLYKKKIESAIKYNMNGYIFEDFISYIFKLLGYKVSQTTGSHDMGKDIILNKNIYVECKCYKDTKISSPSINKLIGACASDGIKQAIFITTGNGYTKDAMKIVNNAKERINVECWDMDDILNLCLKCDHYKVLQWIK